MNEDDVRIFTQNLILAVLPVLIESEPDLQPQETVELAFEFAHHAVSLYLKVCEKCKEESASKSST